MLDFLADRPRLLAAAGLAAGALLALVLGPGLAELIAHTVGAPA